MSGYHLSNRVLYLNSRINFEEVEFPVRIPEEFESCESLVTDSLGSCYYACAYIGSNFFRKPRPFFQDFLVTALNRAESLAEMDSIFSISKDLEFNMLSTFDEFL